MDRRELQAAGRQDSKVLESWKVTQEFFLLECVRDADRRLI